MYVPGRMLETGQLGTAYFAAYELSAPAALRGPGLDQKTVTE